MQKAIFLLLVMFLVACTPTQDYDVEQLSNEDLEKIASDHAEEQKNTVGEAWGYNFDSYYRVPSYQVYRWQAIDELYSRNGFTFSVEICNNNVDDTNNGKIDCADIKTCYSPTNAPKNVCVGDSDKVLLNGFSLGTIHSDSIKSINDIIYTSGEDACQRTLSSSCKHLEKLSNNQWQQVFQNKCNDNINSLSDVSTTNYRAVCGGGKKVTPPNFNRGGILKR